MALGHKSVREAQRWIDPQEFREWIAYDRIDPIGEERADARNALLIASLRRAWGGNDRIEDFMPAFADEYKRELPEDIEARMMMWAESFNQGRNRKLRSANL